MGDRVALVNMPWALIGEPNLGLAILKTCLREKGVGCDVFETPMRLLRYVKYETYEWMAQTWAMNDWMFTSIFKPDVTQHDLDMLEKVFRDSEDALEFMQSEKACVTSFVDKAVKMRQEVVPKFMDDLLDDLRIDEYSYVGFTLLFDQTVASLAMAKRIREVSPSTLIALGGYAAHAPVGQAIQRSFPEVDVVAYGDGEPTVYALHQAARGEIPFSAVPNISYRGEDGELVENDWVTIAMDDSPTPDYDDFFRQREELAEHHEVRFPVGEVPVESSRGCWWGQKSHCIFCGIDDETMRYRKKSTEKTISQLDELSERYRISVFRFSDYIMPRPALKELLPQLIDRGSPYVLHYETKANLTPEELDICEKARVRYLQPGIESFSTPVLKLMAKGVRAMQNISTVFNMNRRRILVFYNVIFGFPGEQPEHYEAMAKLIPAITHLSPPQSTVPVLVTRYAPLHTDPARFGAPNAEMKAHWRYSLIFDEEFQAERNWSNDSWCYYFHSPYREYSSEMKALYDTVMHQIALWKQRYGARSSVLSYRVEDDGVVFFDSRFKLEGETRRFGPVVAQIAETMFGRVWDRAKLINTVVELGWACQQVEEAVEAVKDARIILCEEKQHIWVAFKETDPKSFAVEDYPDDEKLVEAADEVRISRSWEWQPWEAQKPPERLPVVVSS